MSEDEKNVPKRRFKEFENAKVWEQRKLGDITEKIGSGKTPKGGNATYKSEGVQLIRSQNIFDDKVNNIDIAYISEEVDDEMKNSRVYKNDVLLNITGASIGRSAVYKQDVTANVNQHVCILRPFNDYSSEFIQLNLSSDKGQKEIELNQAGGGREGLNFQQIAKMNFFYPDLEEQKYIVSFFEKLNSTITLHQRKLEKMKALKKAYLTDMFPAEGEHKPKLRFAGFTGDWEQRKLGKHAKYRRGSFPQPYGNKEWYDGEGAMPFVQVVDVTDQLTLVEDTKQKISKLAQPKSVFVPKGKVVVTLQGSIGRVAITQYDSYVDRTLLIFEDYVKATDENFWAYTIQKKFDIEKRKAPGGTIKTITKEALSSFEVSLPEYAEQKKIGEFFSNFDHLITLHQCKLEKLQNIKKAYLNEMFI
ncbi:restriction endonuclease subunit S [Clostridium tyrobutyricum]|uniref:restriction endonuclease subunit S n=1 Tax=Clostridium tyrobutyricum TaxID=1519 RepID=UPI00189D4F2A|nr:restriction endonuclease subunit S [Clostridium tyrobutyricum]